MTTIKLTVSGAEISAQVSGVLTAGMAGIPVTLEYDAAWDGLFKTLVCMGEDVRCVPNVQTQATVAPEVMGTGKHLFLGVEGVNKDGSVIIPTLWADCGPIQPSARSDCDETAGAALPVWQQIWRSIGDLEQLKTADRSCLVAAINELAGASGGAAGGGTGGGLSGEAAALLIDILRAGVYSSDQSGQIAALEQKLLGVTPPKPPTEDWVISYNLIGCSTNGAASAAPDSRYEAVLTPFEGYQLSTVRVLMGGQDVTQQVYRDGTLTIPAVTADVYISATATEIQKTYPITMNLTHVTADNPARRAVEGSSYHTVLTAEDGYTMGKVSVTMGGKDITASAYAVRNVNIKTVTGAISITAAASRQEVIGNGWKADQPYDLKVRDNISISTSSGSEVKTDGFAATDYLPCADLTAVKLDGIVYNWHSYDANKKYVGSSKFYRMMPQANLISGENKGDLGGYAVPEGTAYFRCDYRKTNQGIKSVTPAVYPMASPTQPWENDQIYELVREQGTFNGSGAPIPDASWWRSQKIFVYGAKRIIFTSGGRKQVIWYNGEGKQISQSTVNNTVEFTVPSGATYVAISSTGLSTRYFIRIDG